jgi:hypothetical protein
MLSRIISDRTAPMTTTVLLSIAVGLVIAFVLSYGGDRFG